MFGPFGGFEILVLMAIGLLVFGPRRMPEIGRSLGKAMLEFRKAATELRTSIEREINIEEMKETARSIKDGIETEVLAKPREALTRTTRSIKEDIEKNVLAEPREALKETRAALEEAKEKGSLQSADEDQGAGDDVPKS